MWRMVLALLFWVVLPGGSNRDYLSAKRKFSRIENDLVAPGSRISITSRELNAWVRREVPSVAPDGLRDPRLELGHGLATGSAWVDFVKLRTATGRSTNWLLRKLLEGERPVRVTARIQSGSGHATVDVERVEISGMAISGGALDFLIQNFLLPYYPSAKVGVPFELGHRIERLEVEPAGVGVLIAN